MRLNFIQLQISRKRRSRFRTLHGGHDTIIFELALEVKVAKVARRSIRAWGWRVETRISTPLRPTSRSSNVLHYSRMEVRADLFSTRNETSLFVVARPRLPVFICEEATTCVYLRSF